MFWISNAYALGAGQQSGQAQDGNLLTAFAPFILIFAVFYFLLIRPQQKKTKEHKLMLASFKKGDPVITAGGMYGRILEINDDIVVVDLGETKATFGRAYLAAVPVQQAAAAPKKDLKKDKKKDKAEARAEEKAEEAAPALPAAEPEKSVEPENNPAGEK